MKRILLILFLVFISISFLGCDSREIEKGSSLHAGQQKAFDNSIEFFIKVPW